jgi:hypothetical protein
MQCFAARTSYTAVCEVVQGESWDVAQSLPFLTPGIVRAKGFDSVSARGGENQATKNDEYVLYTAAARPSFVVEFVRRRSPPAGW